MTPDVAFSSLIAPFVIAGIGMSFVFPSLANAMLHSVQPEEAGKASGAHNAMREFGTALGVAVLASVFAAAGSYASPQAFNDGMVAALPIGAACLLAAAIAAMFIPARSSRSLRRPRPSPWPRPRSASCRPRFRRPLDRLNPHHRRAGTVSRRDAFSQGPPGVGRPRRTGISADRPSSGDLTLETPLPSLWSRCVCVASPDGWTSRQDLVRGRETAEAMTATLALRGPDAGGIWISAARRHRPPPAGGHRPRRRRAADAAIEPAGEVAVLTYSGEVYNFRELRAELRARGHVPHRERHRGRAARLPGMGRRLRRPAQRHVRLRASGTRGRRSCCWSATGWASSRSTTYGPGRRAVRLRAQGDPGQPAGRPR